MSADPSPETPWHTVRYLVDTGSTGELIIASDAIEIHVYLLDGRLAWATSSTARNEFQRRLVEDHGIASDVLRDVIEECRRTRGRLGETLIAWGVATAEQIRDARGGRQLRVLRRAASGQHDLGVAGAANLGVAGPRLGVAADRGAPGREWRVMAAVG